MKPFQFPPSLNVNALSVGEEIIKDQDYYLETLSLKVGRLSLEVISHLANMDALP